MDGTTPVNPMLIRDSGGPKPNEDDQSVARLDRDHVKRENLCLLILNDLQRSASRSGNRVVLH